MNSATSEVMSHLKLVENYAKIRQMPVGSSGQLKYITVSASNNRLVATANGEVGSTYFNLVLNKEVVIDTEGHGPIIFWRGGQLSTDINGNLFNFDDSAKVYVGVDMDDQLTRRIAISALGLVTDEGLDPDVILTVPTDVPVPTATITPTPRIIPTTAPTPTSSRDPLPSMGEINEVCLDPGQSNPHYSYNNLTRGCDLINSCGVTDERCLGTFEM
jgi:hypothetical protein